jgi:hypothetical protein
MTLKFKFLSGDVNWKEYGGKFISKRLNNGEFDYWLVISVINWHDNGYYDHKYNVSIQAVSPQSVSKENLDRAFESCGMTYSDDPIVQVEVLSDYGISANLWSKDGNNIKQLMKEAHHETNLIGMLFGFYMDKYQNRIGQTGWDLIRGQDIREHLRGL